MKPLAWTMGLAAMLGGCAVYEPPFDPYATYPGAYPTTVYSTPAPAYVGPPLFFNFGYGYYGWNRPGSWYGPPPPGGWRGPPFGAGRPPPPGGWRGGPPGGWRGGPPGGWRGGPGMR